MRRLYCDRCGSEVKNLFVIKVPDRITNNGSYINKDVEVCSNCKQFIDVVVEEYNASMTKARIAFYKTLFTDSVRAEN